MAEQKLPKLTTGVRFPSPAPGKQILRAQMRAHVKTLDWENLSLSIRAYVESLFPSYAAFWPIAGEEPDFRPFGQHVSLPVIHATSKILTFRGWREASSLEEGPYHLPRPDSTCPTIHPEIILVPCLAVDQEGFRLGRGGGFYDATLAAFSMKAIGVLHSTQVIVQLPRELHDHPLDGIVTEHGMMWFPNS